MGSRIRAYLTATPQVATKQEDLAVNDLVLVVDKTVPISRWLLGRVTKVFPREDSRVRTTEVKTKDSSLTRPVTKLCLLEKAAERVCRRVH